MWTPEGIDPRDDRENWFFESLSEDEQNCFPNAVRSDEDVMDHLRFTEGTERRMLNGCLGEAGELALYMLENSETDAPYEEIACIWRGARATPDEGMLNTEPAADRPLTEEVMKEREAERAAFAALRNYCADNTEDREAHILACLVDEAGGPDRFMAANGQRNTVLQELETAKRGQGPCAGTD